MRNAEEKENQKNAFHKKLLPLPFTVFTVPGIGNKVFCIFLAVIFSTKFRQKK